MREALDLHPSFLDSKSVNSYRLPCLVGLSGQAIFLEILIRLCVPSRLGSNCAERPDGPAVIFAGLPGEIGSLEGLGDSLRFILKKRFIGVLG